MYFKFVFSYFFRAHYCVTFRSYIGLCTYVINSALVTYLTFKTSLFGWGALAIKRYCKLYTWRHKRLGIKPKYGTECVLPKHHKHDKCTFNFKGTPANLYVALLSVSNQTFKSMIQWDFMGDLIFLTNSPFDIFIESGISIEIHWIQVNDYRQLKII